MWYECSIANLYRFFSEQAAAAAAAPVFGMPKKMQCQTEHTGGDQGGTTSRDEEKGLCVEKEDIVMNVVMTKDWPVVRECVLQEEEAQTATYVLQEEEEEQQGISSLNRALIEP